MSEHGFGIVGLGMIAEFHAKAIAAMSGGRLVAACSRDKAKAKEKATELLGRLNKGEDFAALAKKHSDAPYADKGGDWGWVKRGTLVSPLDETAAKLKPGEVSDLVETDDGYLIVKVAGVQPATRQSLAEARREIRDRLMGEQRQRRRGELIAKLKTSASILRFELEAQP